MHLDPGRGEKGSTGCANVLTMHCEAERTLGHMVGILQDSLLTNMFGKVDIGSESLKFSKKWRQFRKCRKFGKLNNCNS